MAIACDAKALLAAARCISCLTPAQRRAASTALLCQINAQGGFSGGQNIVPPGSVYSPCFTLAIKINTVYDITWGANDLNATVGTDVYTSTGSGTVTTFYSGTNTSVVLCGTGTVTAKVVPDPRNAPIPTLFAFASDAGFANVVASWGAPPGQVTKTEVWTSADNITFALFTTVNAPGTTGNATIPAIGSSVYCKVRWIAANGNVGTFTGSIVFTHTDWETRVVANGGDAPGALNKSVQNNFYSALQQGGILAKMINVNLLDTHAKSANYRTPIIRTAGSDPWTNNNYGDGSITINGLPGAGVGDFLNSGVLGTNFPSDANGGFSVYSFNDGAEANLYHLGYTNNAATVLFGILVNNAGTMRANMWNDTSAVSVASPGAGFYSVNRVAANDLRVYFAKSSSGIAQVGTTSAGASGARAAAAIYIPGVNATDQANAGVLPTADTISFVGFHQGLALAEAKILYNAAQAARVAYGGGFV